MLREAYKVVRQVDGKLVSCWAKPPLQITYQQNRWIKRPATGPLLCFATEKDVRRFLSLFNRIHRSQAQVYRCEVRRPRKIKWLVRDTFTKATALAFWQLRNRSRNRSARMAPQGTLACDAIKLIEEIPLECLEDCHEQTAADIRRNARRARARVVGTRTEGHDYTRTP